MIEKRDNGDLLIGGARGINEGRPLVKLQADRGMVVNSGQHVLDAAATMLEDEEIEAIAEWCAARLSRQRVSLDERGMVFVGGELAGHIGDAPPDLADALEAAIKGQR